MLCLPAVGQACEYCLISQGISPLQTQNGTGLRMGQRYSRLDSVYNGDNEESNPGVKEQYWTTELSGFFSLSPQLMVFINAPLRRTDGDGELTEGPDGAPEREDVSGDAQGIGDVSLMTRYTFSLDHSLDRTTLVAGVLGVKLPTGNTHQHNDQGEYLDSHLQLGTGSTDVLVGLSVDHAVNRISMSANVLASFPNDGETGDQAHRFGNSVNYDVTGKFRLQSGSPGSQPDTWFVAMGINGEYREHEQLDGETVHDSGGNTLYLTPGVEFVHGGNWIVEVIYQYAIHHHFNETQLGEDYKVYASLTHLF
jgi:hypothetical protein